MKENMIAFIDVETTGLDFCRHELIEIGCVITKQIGDTVDTVSEHEWKVKPTRIEDAEPDALRLNGYSPGEWVFAMDLAVALSELSAVADGAYMAAHNISFDNAFLQKAFRETGVENKMHHRCIDTLTYAIAKLEKDDSIDKYSLGFLCKHFGIENERAHTALSDARATVSIYRELLKL